MVDAWMILVDAQMLNGRCSDDCWSMLDAQMLGSRRSDGQCSTLGWLMGDGLTMDERRAIDSQMADGQMVDGQTRYQAMTNLPPHGPFFFLLRT